MTANASALRYMGDRKTFDSTAKYWTEVGLVRENSKLDPLT